MATRTASRSSIVTRTAPARRVVVVKAKQAARRVGGAALGAARDESHTLLALGAAGALGYAQRENMLDSIPHIDAIGVDGTLGALAWVAGRWMKSKNASHVATGLLCVAINRLARGE